MTTKQDSAHARLKKALHELVDSGDWHSLECFAAALMSGEWDTMSELDQDEWLSGVEE